MKKILIDLNIILDFLNKRNFHEEAAQIIDMCFENIVEGYLCAHEITTLSYYLHKETKDRAKINHTITTLLDGFNILPVDETVLRDSLISTITDYEDAVIEASAVGANLDYIISRNLVDFKHSRIPAYTPEQFLILLDQTPH